jgi:predicted mannosyl-3-phosphoglycerate phosphatase (HAD superfamily)
MYVIADLPSPSFMDFDYTMIGFTELKDTKNLQRLKDLGKSIISYTPKTREEITFSYNL